MISLAAAAAISHSVNFSPPATLGAVHWGVTAAYNFSSFTAIGTLHGTLLSTDDLTYTHATNASIPGGMVKSGASYHTLGTLTADTTFTSWHAPNCVQWTLDAGQFTVTTLDAPVSFVGLPSSSKASRFTGSNGLRFSGAASVVRNGVHLQTAIVAFSDMKNDTDATSVVLYSSDDSFSYTYLSTIASAADNPWSDEGPNEHAMELLADGSLLVVFRIDCGDGPNFHPFVPYWQTRSRDGGKSWDAPVPSPGAPGCAYPHLLRLESGPLLLSGGRSLYAGTNDNDLWVSWAGDGAAWERHAISAAHNALAPAGTPEFDPTRVNATMPECAGAQTVAYTSLVARGASSAVIGYDMTSLHCENHTGFAMLVEFTQ